MREEQLDVMLHRLFNNDSMAFKLSRIFNAVTEGRVVSKEDFDCWFQVQIEEMFLKGGRDYKYRVPGDIDSVYVGGIVGLAMILRADNEIGAYANRHYTRPDRTYFELFGRVE